MTQFPSKSGDFQRFHHRAIAERQMVIHKIPVDIEAKPDVRPQRNQQPLWAQHPVRLRETVGKILFGGEVFEEVAAEYHVDGLRGQGPRLSGLLRKHGNAGGGFIRGGRV